MIVYVSHTGAADIVPPGRGFPLVCLTIKAYALKSSNCGSMLWADPWYDSHFPKDTNLLSTSDC